MYYVTLYINKKIPLNVFLMFWFFLLSLQCRRFSLSGREGVKSLRSCNEVFYAALIGTLHTKCYIEWLMPSWNIAIRPFGTSSTLALHQGRAVYLVRALCNLQIVTVETLTRCMLAAFSRIILIVHSPLNGNLKT